MKYSRMKCEKCKETVPRKSGNQRYCTSCSALLSHAAHKPARPLGDYDWTDEKVEELKLIVAQASLSCAQIAEKFGCTRNAVLGKARRLGLHLHHWDKCATHVVKAKGPGPAPKPALVRGEDVQMAPKPRHPLVSILEIGPAQCRYPFGEAGSANFGFCGKSSVYGSSWCAEHFERVHTTQGAAAYKYKLMAGIV